MEQVSRHFRRSFHDASVSYSSLAHATLRATAPFSAEYPPLISVAYTWIHDNRESHQLATDIKRRNDGSRQTPKAEEFASARRAGTDFVRRGDGPDPRLVELARLLARRAAREVFEEQTKGRRTTRS
jgi:hypothetical protein